MRPRPAMRFLLAVALVAACSDDSAEPSGDGGTDSSGADAGPLGAFESFRHSSAGGLCPDDMDCAGFIELTSDRVLLVDRTGELPVVIHQTEVTAAELDDAIPVLTDRALVALLDLGEAPCVPPSDVFEDMTLFEGGRQHSNSVTLCDDAPIAAARATLRTLADAYFP